MTIDSNPLPDLAANSRMNAIMRAMDKMHNGLLAMIAAHQEYVEKTDARIAALEEKLNPKE